jgi:UDP-N-acetylmuramoyl-L-alanyl-D-glutamate--2,6-diaminopimelate ligase
VRLPALLGSLSAFSQTGAVEDAEISALAYDSRDVGPGTLFFCVPGGTADGHDFAAAAVEAGAAALVVERMLPVPVPQVVVASVRATMGPIADRFFGEPSAQLRVVGVTGTNGKTTTVFLQQAILAADGVATGLLGTIERRIGGVPAPAGRTTAEAIDLHGDLRRMLDAGDRACAMEVSSHALDQDRVGGVRFAAAAFTNLSHDHLDYHADMEDYFAAKARLFDGRCPAATNLDDPYGRRLEVDLGYSAAGAAAADVVAEGIVMGPDVTRFTLRSPWGSADIQLRLVGRYNVENALAAAASCGLAGASLDAIARGLGELPGVPGRLERVERGQDFAVLVDYAHTPDALAKALAAVREITTGRVHVVFGCGGDRDRAKRPEMAAAACTGADRVIVTSDNPRGEDPEAIVAEIVAGADGPVAVEIDRRTAIRRAIGEAEPGDSVLIAGKGHEQGQEADGQVVPFDDRTVAAEALA